MKICWKNLNAVEARSCRYHSWSNSLPFLRQKEKNWQVDRLCFSVWSSCQFFYFCRRQEREYDFEHCCWTRWREVSWTRQMNCMFLPAGSTGCMRDWLNMSGAATSDLDRLEEKTRSFHLSEGQIRHVYPVPVLRALLPVSVATKLKTCVGKTKGVLRALDMAMDRHFPLEVGHVVLVLSWDILWLWGVSSRQCFELETEKNNNYVVDNLGCV